MPKGNKSAYSASKQIGIGDLKKSKVASGKVKSKATRKGMT